MCRWLSNILFPTEVTGRKRQCVSYRLPDSASGIYPIIVKATGKRIHMSLVYDYGYYQPFHPTDITNVNDQTVTVMIGNSQYIKDKLVYFNCIGVTYLEIDGERYI